MSRVVEYHVITVPLLSEDREVIVSEFICIFPPNNSNADEQKLLTDRVEVSPLSFCLF